MVVEVDREASKSKSEEGGTIPALELGLGAICEVAPCLLWL
jgi:hypothetical protein